MTDKADMSDRLPSAALVRSMAAELRGEDIGEQRAAELAADLRRILGHAQAAAAGNDFNDEPNQFPAVLAGLVVRKPGQP